jgi:hypothetical protein
VSADCSLHVVTDCCGIRAPAPAIVPGQISSEIGQILENLKPSTTRWIIWSRRGLGSVIAAVRLSMVYVLNPENLRAAIFMKWTSVPSMVRVRICRCVATVTAMGLS